jgi:LacI family transcriptional regulator
MSKALSIFINLPEADKRQNRHIVRGLLMEAEGKAYLKINLSSFFLLEHLRSEMEKGVDGILTDGGYPDGPPGLLGQVPMVGVRHPFDTGKLPRVLVDPRSVAEAALRHFQEHGVKYFGVFHNMSPASPEGLIRSEAFCELLQQKGISPQVFPNGPRCTVKWEFLNQIHDLADWLRDLPKPCGILVGDDEHAQRLLLAAVEAEVAVPHEVAVLSYGNDALFCDAMHPSLSSIDPRGEDVGAESLRRLLEEIEGHPRRERITWLSCGPVIRRESTDRRFSDFPYVQRALRIFEKDMAEIGTSRQLAETLGVSHNTLNTMFREATGSSTWAYFRKRRLDHAKHLLETTDLGLADICAETGISTVSQLSKDIKNTYGKTPKQFRKR